MCDQGGIDEGFHDAWILQICSVLTNSLLLIALAAPDLAGGLFPCNAVRVLGNYSLGGCPGSDYLIRVPLEPDESPVTC